MEILRAKQGRQGPLFRDWAITSIMNEIIITDISKFNIIFFLISQLSKVYFWPKERRVALNFNEKVEQSADVNGRHICLTAIFDHVTYCTFCTQVEIRGESVVHIFS